MIEAYALLIMKDHVHRHMGYAERFQRIFDGRSSFDFIRKSFVFSTGGKKIVQLTIKTKMDRLDLHDGKKMRKIRKERMLIAASHVTKLAVLSVLVEPYRSRVGRLAFFHPIGNPLALESRGVSLGIFC